MSRLTSAATRFMGWAGKRRDVFVCFPFPRSSPHSCLVGNGWRVGCSPESQGVGQKAGDDRRQNAAGRRLGRCHGWGINAGATFCQPGSRSATNSHFDASPASKQAKAWTPTPIRAIWQRVGVQPLGCPRSKIVDQSPFLTGLQIMRFP